MNKILISLALTVAALTGCGSDHESAARQRLAAAATTCDTWLNSTGQYVGHSILTNGCMAETLMTPALYAQWGSTTAMSGTQSSSENGLTFTFSYNGLSEDSLLTVTAP